MYVAGFDSDNVFQITPAGDITQIIGPDGDGMGNILDFGFFASAPVVDGNGNVYVAGRSSDNVFQITGSTITQILTLDNPSALVLDSDGILYVTAGGCGKLT